jgi:hypothetical protein
MHGEGTLTYSNGNTYKGNFNEGKKFGHGVFTNKQSGSIYSGKWCGD